MKKETMTVDDIECPYCGRIFDGAEATNYDTSCGFVNCPTCDGEIEVLQSVTYTCHPAGNQGLENKMAKIKIDMEHGIIYECPECGGEVEMGQSYCQDCGEPLEWTEEE